MLSRTPSPAQPRSRQQHNPSLWPLLLLLALINLATSLYTLPLNRVIEQRLCKDHYNQHEGEPYEAIPEKLCKIDEVQKRLAWLQGIMETTAVVCDALITIPFSFVAERLGIRVVLFCNLVPRLVLSVVAIAVGKLDHILPTEAILVGPFLALLGGECVFSSTVFTLTSSLAGEYVQRSSYFSYISSISYVVAFIGPSLASSTMSQSLWLPFWINIALLICAIPTIHMLPNTKRPQPLSSSICPADESGVDPDSARPLLAEDHDRHPLSPNASPHAYANAFETRRTAVQSIVHAARTIVHLVTGRRNFQIILASCFLTALASSDTKLLVQYISKRYECTFATAGYMLSAKAVVNIVLLAIVVPRLIRTSMSTKTVHGSEVRLNYLGAELSIAISIFGVLCVGLAFKFWMLLGALVIYAIGSALPIFVLSLIKSPLIALSDSETGNQDFSIMMLTKTMGSLVGAPLMTVLWVQAIKLGGVGLGLPYFVSASVYLAAAFVVAKLQF